MVFNIKINLFILFSILATIKPIISIIIYHPMSFDVRLPKDVELLSGPMRQYKEFFFCNKGNLIFGLHKCGTYQYVYINNKKGDLTNFRCNNLNFKTL